MVDEQTREEQVLKGEQEYDEAVFQIERGEYEIAFSHFEIAEQIFKQLNDQHWLTFIYHEKFRIFRQLGKQDEALNLSESIIDGYLDTKNQKGLALAHIHKADILGETGKNLEALSNLRIAEAIIVSEKISDLFPYLASSFSKAHMDLGEYYEAIKSLNSALKFFGEESTTEEKAWCTWQLAICYKELFNLPMAEKNFLEALNRYIQTGNDECTQEILKELKELYSSSGQNEKLSGLNSLGKQKRY